MDKNKFSLKESAPFIVLAATAVIVAVIIYDQGEVNFQLPDFSLPGAVIAGFFLLIALFLIFREFALWYWKINRIVELLEQIEENTRK